MPDKNYEMSAHCKIHKQIDQSMTEPRRNWQKWNGLNTTKPTWPNLSERESEFWKDHVVNTITDRKQWNNCTESMNKLVTINLSAKNSRNFYHSKFKIKNWWKEITEWSHCILLYPASRPGPAQAPSIHPFIQPASFPLSLPLHSARITNSYSHIIPGPSQTQRWTDGSKHQVP